jgi:membrane fusion protein (multidrug efflux system)
MYEQQGDFDFVDNKVDEKTGTVLVRAVFPNPDRLLLPGQFVTVVIEREEAKDEVLIPQAAVLTDQGGNYVLLVNDQNEVEARRVQTGQRFGPNVVVGQGLQAGERIVMYGIQKTRPGITVRPELTAPPGDPLTGGMDNATTESVTAEEGTETGDEDADEGAAAAAEESGERSGQGGAAGEPPADEPDAGDGRDE